MPSQAPGRQTEFKASFAESTKQPNGASWRQSWKPLRPYRISTSRHPDFDANTTHGRRKLADYKGKWLILFSHPADFTPVCTTEFTAFAKAWLEFQKHNCEMLGLSIDSSYAHIAWVHNIKQNFRVDIPFPVIEDLSMKVAHAYGMIQPA